MNHIILYSIAISNMEIFFLRILFRVNVIILYFYPSVLGIFCKLLLKRRLYRHIIIFRLPCYFYLKYSKYLLRNNIFLGHTGYVIVIYNTEC